MMPPTTAAQGVKVAQPLVMTIMPASRQGRETSQLRNQDRKRWCASGLTRDKVSPLLQHQRQQLTAEGAVPSGAQVPHCMPGRKFGHAQLHNDAGHGSKTATHRGGNHTARNHLEHDKCSK